MVGQEGTKTLSGSIDSSVIQRSVLLHVLFIDHADDGFGLVNMHLGVLELQLVVGSDDSKSIVANQLLGLLLGLAMIRA